MNFKQWFLEVWDTEDSYDALDAMADDYFGQKKINQLMNFNDIISKLGLPAVRVPPQPINSGSLATIYPNPHTPGTIIKVTADISDIKNIEKAQSLRSPNIVKLHQSAYISPKIAVAILDFVKGSKIRLSISEILALAENGYAQAARDILKPKQLQAKILNKHGMNHKIGRYKWSEFFQTMAKLENIGIELDDLADNIIDNSRHLVLVDLGL